MVIYLNAYLPHQRARTTMCITPGSEPAFHMHEPRNRQGSLSAVAASPRSLQTGLWELAWSLEQGPRCVSL